MKALKAGYRATPLNSFESPLVVKAKLTERNVPFYTLTYEGDELIAYPEEFEQQVLALRSELSGGPPPNHEGLCYQSEERAIKQTELLSASAIPFTVRQMPRYKQHCVYWPASYDSKVQEVDPMYSALLKAKSEHEKSNK